MMLSFSVLLVVMAFTVWVFAFQEITFSQMKTWLPFIGVYLVQNTH